MKRMLPYLKPALFSSRLYVALIAVALLSIATQKALMQRDTPPGGGQSTQTDASIQTATLPKQSGSAKGNPEHDVGVPIVNPNLVTATTYPFTSAAGVALEDMSTGTTQLVGANLDDTASAVTNIGFDFWYDGVRFTQFSVNANGLSRLGGTAVSTAFDNSTTFNSTTNAPKIAPYFDDLWTGTNGKVHFKVTGSAPSRKLIVEWLNEQIPRVGSGSTGAGTFQMWLFETTGVIEFVYGNGIAVNSPNAGYSIGLQSGAATNFASVTSSGPTVSYAAANNTQTNAIASGTKYTFTPNVPAAPTGLNFTSVLASSMTLNWTDNATNEVGYVIYNSTDGTNFTFVTQTAANATSQNVTGLTPSTNYFWRVFAVTEGALSTALTGSQMTAAPGMINSTAAGGNWSAAATWAGGVVPNSSDNVTILDGATVTIDTAATALNVTVGSVTLAPTGGATATLQYESTTARTLTVGQSVAVSSNGVVQSAATGTVTTHVLSIGGNLTNDGTLDFSTNANTAGASITFTGAASATFGGMGATTDIRAITINKGTSSASVLDVTTTNFTVRGVTTDVAGFLTLTNGTFKISGNFTVTNRVFTTAIYTIPATAGIWLNNPNFIVAGTVSSTTTTNLGLFRVTQGTYNIGVGAGDEMGGGTGAMFIIEGGTVNASGRLDPQSAVTYTQTAGTVNVATVGNTRSLFGSFEIFNTGSTFNMSGGTINVINRNTGATQVDYDVLALTTNVTGGLLVIGATGAPAATSYHVQGSTPNLTINSTMTMIVTNNASANFPLFMRGTTVTNNGTITSNAAGSRFDFTGNGPMTYTGGTFGTIATPFGGVGVSANSTSMVTLNSPIVCNRINLFQGGFINSNQITLGNGGTSTTVVQVGSAGLTTPGGSFDVSPNHMQGTGGEILLYLFETAPRTTGVEINPTRILTSMTVDNPNNLTIAGGNLTLSSTAAALTMTNGRIITGANTLALSSGTATVTRTNGYVDGNFRKTYAAAANKTFEVGTANGFSPVAVNVTAGTFPADFTVKAVQGAQPNVLSPTHALQRYWTLTGTGVTADLTFNYLDPTDIPMTANENAFVILKYDGMFTMPGGMVNTAANQATITGVTSFSDWTLGEPGSPTAINLISFTADRFAGATNSPKGGVLLRWQTGQEVANLGFNVYRDEDGKRVRLTPGLVAGSALFVGARTELRAGRSYAWIDSTSQSSGAQFWLEEVALDGTSKWYGPVFASASGGGKSISAYDLQQSALLTDLGRGDGEESPSVALERKAKIARLTKGRVFLQEGLVSQAAVKLSVRQEGWYRVTQPELIAAGLNPKTDARMLQLFVDGQEQAINIVGTKDAEFGSSAAIEFYGLGLDTPSTDTRVYWVTVGTTPGKRIQQVKADASPASAVSFPYTVERKDRFIYFSALRNGERENFFGPVIGASPVEQSLTVQRLDQAAGQAQLEVSVQGVTAAAHQVRVQLNGFDVGQVVFSGQSQGTAKLSVSAVMLKEGQNLITLSSQGGSGDISLAESVRLTYRHTYLADNNSLRLTAAGNQSVTIGGFTNGEIRVVDVTGAAAPQELLGTLKQDKGSYSITVAAAGAGERQLLAFTEQNRKPARIAANLPSSWRQTANGADLLIITRRELMSSLDPLRSLRQSQNLKVAVIDIEDLYDEFSFSQKSAQAVKDFLTYARSSWKVAPRYVLLAGDASLDPRNYMGLGDSDLVPTRMIDTAYLETACDDCLADVNNDGLPEMAVGRLPVRTAQETAALVSKIIAYDGSRAAEGVLLVSDINDVYSFEAATAQLQALIPAGVRIEKIERGRMDPAAAKAKLIDALNRGPRVVNYTGHGSVDLWRGNLLTSADVAQLTNDRALPLFVTMTCLNGYFLDPGFDSLAEGLIKSSRGGAVAVWASSGMSLPGGQALMNQQMFRNIFGGQSLTLGDATARAKAAMGDPDVRRTWILFGDPTSRLR
jgi:peptidase C25-like protein/fibronectin type III domain protein